MRDSQFSEFKLGRRLLDNERAKKFEFEKVCISSAFVDLVKTFNYTFAVLSN